MQIQTPPGWWISRIWGTVSQNPITVSWAVNEWMCTIKLPNLKRILRRQDVLERQRSLVFVCVCCFYSGGRACFTSKKNYRIFEALPTFLQLDLVMVNGDPNFTFLRRPEHMDICNIYIHLYTYNMYIYIYLSILSSSSFFFGEFSTKLLQLRKKSYQKIFKMVYVVHESFSFMVLVSFNIYWSSLRLRIYYLPSGIN